MTTTHLEGARDPTGEVTEVVELEAVVVDGGDGKNEEVMDGNLGNNLGKNGIMIETTKMTPVTIMMILLAAVMETTVVVDVVVIPTTATISEPQTSLYKE